MAADLAIAWLRRACHPVCLAAAASRTITTKGLPGLGDWCSQMMQQLSACEAAAEALASAISGTTGAGCSFMAANSSQHRLRATAVSQLQQQASQSVHCSDRSTAQCTTTAAAATTTHRVETPVHEGKSLLSCAVPTLCRPPATVEQDQSASAAASPNGLPSGQSGPSLSERVAAHVAQLQQEAETAMWHKDVCSPLSNARSGRAQQL